MTLAVGTRFGRYEVTAQIGAGGMGEVYRATDVTLRRDVAIKVLPERLLADTDRVARFEREARTLAALNHPNIATVFGLEEGSGTHALVMELVDGVTLVERLAHAPALAGHLPAGLGLPLDEALRIARQIAFALKVAHEQGIIHRDLKPANIKIREDGTVKVLDFGLAKIMDLPGTEAAPGSPLPPTVTNPALTKAGAVLGTPAYMSPEQVSGRPAGKGADIWAFGCVLFEMLTGRRAFDGEDVSDTLALVLVKEPEWSRLPLDLPAPIRLLLSRALDKNQRTRLADISAALLLIEELPSLSAPAASNESVVRAQIDVAVADARRAVIRGTRWRVAAAGVVGLALAALVGFRAWLTPGYAPAVVRTMVTTAGPASLTKSGFDRDVVITPDGARIVYRGQNQLLVRALDSLTPVVLTNVSNPQGLFVSPDGKWAGFFDGNSALWKVPIAGGQAVRLTSTNALFPRGATWTDDDLIVYAYNGSEGLWAVPAAGGEPTRLTTMDRGRGGEHVSPEALPGGRAVLFTLGNLGASDIAVLDLRTRTYQTVVRGGRGARYVESGHLVYGNGASLLAVPFDPDRLSVTGDPVTLIEQPAMTPGSGFDGAVSRTGTLAYVPGAASIADVRTLVWVDRQGREEPVPAPRRTYQMVRLSPDGTRAALDIRDQDNDIWVWAFASGTLTRLTAAPGNDMYPLWTPDGRHLIFTAAADGEGRAIAWRPADGSSSAEVLLRPVPGDSYRPYQISSDGSVLMLSKGDDLVALDLDNGSRGLTAGHSPDELRPLLETSFIEQNGELSPDGRWLAYQSNESGRDEVYVRPFPNLDTARRQVSTTGGRTPVWARSGEELFFGTLEGAVMSVRVQPGPSWQTGAPALVVGPGYFHAGEVHRTFDVSPDGERLLMIKQSANADDVLRSIVVVQNWHEELERLAPAN